MQICTGLDANWAQLWAKIQIMTQNCQTARGISMSWPASLENPKQGLRTRRHSKPTLSAPDFPPNKGDLLCATWTWHGS
jgi:hypothetical protein